MCALYAGFYNNVLVGVAHAQAVHDVRRIAILDFDVCDACDTQHGTCPSRAHRCEIGRGDARARGFQREYKTNTQTRKESETVNAVFYLPTRERRFVMTDCVTSYYYVNLVTRVLSTSTFTLKLERFVNNHPP